MLAFIAQHTIDDTRLLEILTTPASPSPDNLMVYWDCQIACEPLKVKHSKFLPQTGQSTYSMIEAMWAHPPRIIGGLFLDMLQ